MKTFICLAISCLLVGLLYVYVRQQFAQQSAQITSLAEMMRSVAEEVANSKTRTDLKCLSMPMHAVQSFDPVVVEDASESDTDEEGETDDEGSDSEADERQPVSDDEVEDDRKQVQTDQIMEYVINVPAPTISEAPPSMEEITEVILNSEEPSLAKVVVLETSNFEEWSMKQLKEKVNQMGGPGSLRSKKAMVEFLEKNIR